MSMNPLLNYRIKQALRKKRLLTDKQREKIARKRGGFDVSKINKETLRHIEETQKTCQFCYQPVKAIADNTHKTGVILMTCESDGCYGNVDTPRRELKRTCKKTYGRLIDQELCFDLGKLLIGRDPGRLTATRQRIVL